MHDASQIPNETERQIAVQVVDDLLAAGLQIQVWNGGDEPELEFSTDRAAILGALAASDEDQLVTIEHGADPTTTRRRSVHLIYGNGADLISDYTTSLDPILARANALAERFD